MTCGTCQQIQKDFPGARAPCEGIDSVEECPTGEVAKLARSNERFWFLVQRILPGAFDGWGAVQYGAIDSVLRAFGVPREEHAVIYEKCLTVLTVIREIREQERKK